MDGMSWPAGSVLKHWIDARTNCPSNLDPDQVEAQIAAAPLAWCAVADVRFERTNDQAEANLLSYWDPTVEGVNCDYLALTQLPEQPTPSTQLHNRLDPDVAGGWTLRLLYLTEVHEIGHFLGQIHSPAGVPAIMSAVINQSLDGLTPFDVANIQADYGPANPPIRIQLPDGGTLVYTPPPSPTAAAGPFAPTSIALPDGATIVLQFTPAGASPASPGPAVPVATNQEVSMNPFLVLASTGALKLLHDELAAGAPGDVAIRSVLTAIEAQLTNPIVRAVVTDVLGAIVSAAEAAVAAA